MQTIEGKISRANTLMTSMATQHSTWKAQLDRAHSNIRTAPGDALLAVASACYHGPLDQGSREKLLGDWLGRCQSGRFVDVEKSSGQVSSSYTVTGREEVRQEFSLFLLKWQFIPSGILMKWLFVTEAMFRSQQNL